MQQIGLSFSVLPGEYLCIHTLLSDGLNFRASLPERPELSLLMMHQTEFEQNRNIIFPSVLPLLCLH